MTVKMRTTGLRALILMIPLLLLLCWTQPAKAEASTVFNVDASTTINEIQSRISDDTTTTFVFPADGTARSWNGTAFTLTRDNKIIHFVFPEGSKVYFNAVPGNPLFTCAAGVQNAGVVISGPGSLTVSSGTSLIDNGNFTLDGTNLSAKEMTGAAFSADGKTFRMISGSLTVLNCGGGFDWNGPAAFESGTLDISGSGGTGPIRTSGALTFGSSADNAAADRKSVRRFFRLREKLHYLRRVGGCDRRGALADNREERIRHMLAAGIGGRKLLCGLL